MDEMELMSYLECANPVQNWIFPTDYMSYFWCAVSESVLYLQNRIFPTDQMEAGRNGMGDSIRANWVGQYPDRPAGYLGKENAVPM